MLPIYRSVTARGCGGRRCRRAEQGPPERIIDIYFTALLASGGKGSHCPWKELQPLPLEGNSSTITVTPIRRTVGESSTLLARAPQRTATRRPNGGKLLLRRSFRMLK